MDKIRLMFTMILVCALGLTCGPLSRFVPTPNGSNSTQSAAQGLKNPGGTQSAPGTPAGLTIDNLVKGTINLRSVRMTLLTTRPDGVISKLVDEVDATGNEHLVRTYTGGTFDLKSSQPAPGAVEFYVIQGVAYSHDENGNLQQDAATASADYLQAVLVGPDGPAFWLKILPSGSYKITTTQPSGDIFPGEQPREYTVSGNLGDQTIRGSLTVDLSVLALLAAELDIPAPLADPAQTTGMHISFVASPTAIAPIQPDLSQATVQTATPSISGPAEFAGLKLYPDATIAMNQGGQLMFTSKADMAVLVKFYTDQLTTNGWTESEEPMNTSSMYFSSWTKSGHSVDISIQPNPPSGSLVVLVCKGCG